MQCNCAIGASDKAYRVTSSLKLSAWPCSASIKWLHKCAMQRGHAWYSLSQARSWLSNLPVWRQLQHERTWCMARSGKHETAEDEPITTCSMAL